MNIKCLKILSLLKEATIKCLKSGFKKHFPHIHADTEECSADSMVECMVGYG